MHDAHSADGGKPRGSAANTLCLHFMSAGHCRRGAECENAHGLHATEANPARLSTISALRVAAARRALGGHMTQWAAKQTAVLRGRFDRLVQDEVWLRLAVLRRGAAVEHVAAMLAPCIGSETADAFAPEYVRRLRGTSARADGDVGRSFADADLERSFAALLQSKQPPQRPQPLPAAARLQAAETARRQTLQTFLLQCHDRACRSASALQPDPAAALQPGPAAALQPDPAAALQLGPAADGAPAAKRRRVSCSALAALCRQEEGARAALQEGIQAAFRQAFRKLHRRAAAA